MQRACNSSAVLEANGLCKSLHRQPVTTCIAIGDMAVIIASLLCFSLMLSCTFSQPTPTRPVLPNSFSEAATLEIYGGAGQASVAWDFETGSNLQLIELPTCGVVSAIMTRYDMKKIYAISGLGGLQRCVEIPLPGNKPDVGNWDWVKDATYEGKSSELTGEMLDIWASNSSGKKLGVAPDKPNVPVAVLLNGGSPTQQILYRIVEFVDATPRPEAFDIPGSCPKSSEVEAVHPIQLLSLAMPSLRMDLSGTPLIKTMPGLFKS